MDVKKTLEVCAISLVSQFGNMISLRKIIIYQRGQKNGSQIFQILTNLTKRFVPFDEICGISRQGD